VRSLESTMAECSAQLSAESPHCPPHCGCIGCRTRSRRLRTARRSRCRMTTLRRSCGRSTLPRLQRRQRIASATCYSVSIHHTLVVNSRSEPYALLSGHVCDRAVIGCATDGQQGRRRRQVSAMDRPAVLITPNPQIPQTRNPQTPTPTASYEPLWHPLHAERTSSSQWRCRPSAAVNCTQDRQLHSLDYSAYVDGLNAALECLKGITRPLTFGSTTPPTRRICSSSSRAARHTRRCSSTGARSCCRLCPSASRRPRASSSSTKGTRLHPAAPIRRLLCALCGCLHCGQFGRCRCRPTCGLTLSTYIYHRYSQYLYLPAIGTTTSRLSAGCLWTRRRFRSSSHSPKVLSALHTTTVHKDGNVQHGSHSVLKATAKLHCRQRNREWPIRTALQHLRSVCAASAR
jgi:hypothetical protein